MGNGKRGTAPCGHPGEAVVGQYYHCLSGCDDVDFELEVVTPVVALERCPACGSLDVESFALDPIYYIYNPQLAIVTLHCVTCGNCW